MAVFKNTSISLGSTPALLVALQVRGGVKFEVGDSEEVNATHCAPCGLSDDQTKCTAANSNDEVVLSTKELSYQTLHAFVYLLHVSLPKLLSRADPHSCKDELLERIFQNKHSLLTQLPCCHD